MKLRPLPGHRLYMDAKHLKTICYAIAQSSLCQLIHERFRLAKHTSQIPITLMATEGPSQIPDHLDYLIIGGGIAGLYTAWRLSEHTDPSISVGLLESSDRIGGRLLSIKTPVLRQVANLGAMRYLPSQWIIDSLVKRVFGEAATEPHDYATAFLRIRGRTIQVSDKSLQRNQSAYAVRTSFKRMLPDSLVCEALSCALNNIELNTNAIYTETTIDPEVIQLKLKALTPRHLGTRSYFSASDWRIIREYGQFDNVPLYRLSFWDVLANVLDPEETSYVFDGLGYHSIIGLWNAAEAIPWFASEFGGDRYLTLSDGMQELTSRLAQEWSDRRAKHRSDDRLMLNCRVADIHVPESKGDALTVGVTIGATTREPQRAEITANNVILAIPPGAMARLPVIPGNANNKTLNNAIAQFRHQVRSIQQETLLKVFIWFRTPWWTEKPYRLPQKFKCLTDLPLRQIYFCADKQDDGSRSIGRGLVMAYCDSVYANYWRSLAKTFDTDTPWADPEVRTHTLWTECEHLIDRYGISHRFAKRLETCLSQALDKPVNFKDVGALTGMFMDWTSPDFYAGWHSWPIGEQTWSMRQSLHQPIDGINFYSCGEGISCEQGWVEGALRSSERVLRKLGVPQPNWLSSGYNIGFSDFREYVEF
jgi:hypothetical protein